MPRKSSKKKKSRTKRRKKRVRPYKRHHKTHKMRRRILHHGHKFKKEMEMSNYLLNQMLKTITNPDYNYHPRHHTKDREYKHVNKRHQEFKKGFPSPDTNFWRPSGAADSGTWTAAPYRGNVAHEEEKAVWRPRDYIAVH